MSKRRKPSSIEFPVIVERGATGTKGTAKIYATPVTVGGKRYPSYTVVHHHLGKRHRERFNDYAKAFSFAEEKAIRLSNGAIGAISLSGEDQRIYADAVQGLNEVGMTLDVAVREYLSARKILKNVSLLEAARFYDCHGRTITKKGTLREIYDAMLAGLKADGRSDYHVRDITTRVGAFVQHFGPDVTLITTSQIDAWLRGLKISSRTRDNYRDAIHNFFNFARSEGYLPKERPTAAADTKRVNAAGSENHVFTPAEMTTMLTAAPKWIIPTLALKSFCGIRTEELFYLKWENIRFEQGIIWLEKKITKKKQSRAVPILPNLKLWLEPYRDEKGSVAERWSSPQSMTKAWSERAKHVGVKYKRNAMRNSYISYRLADTKKIQQVALESGNSPPVIQGEYWELVTEAEALAWFSIVPKST